MPITKLFPQESDSNPRAERPTKNPLKRILSYFWKPDTLLIGISALLCAIFHRWIDLLLVLLLLFGNVGVMIWKGFQIGKKITFFHKKRARRG